jgi:uncharacterized protein YndB with AHSA1/START domain
MGMPAGEVWELIRDPHHLPRWWPRVERVEGVHGALFTQVLRSSSGKLVRADFEVSEVDETQMRIVWSQQIAGTPFAHVLSASYTELHVQPRLGGSADAVTEVTLTLDHRPKGWFSRAPVMRSEDPGTAFWTAGLGRLGSPLVSKAAARTVKEALDGLQRISG